MICNKLSPECPSRCRHSEKHDPIWDLFEADDINPVSFREGFCNEIESECHMKEPIVLCRCQ